MNAQERRALAFQTLTRERDEAHTAIRFLIDQLERLAVHYMACESDEWIAKNDALNCGRRALGITPVPKTNHDSTDDRHPKDKFVQP